jgi:DNA-binding response OmpR family regulator
MGRVLLIDGEAARRIAMASALCSAPHEVEIASTAAVGSVVARAFLPDLILVAAALPDGSAAEFCAHLRRDPTTMHTLVLVVGAAETEAERVGVFEAGVDDYVPHPVSMREVLLRVRALLRRMAARGLVDVVAVGAVRVDRGTRRVTVDGVNVSLTRREFDLLARLIDGRGRALARETLVADVWPDDAPSQRAVDTTLKRLRKKLPSLGSCIRTIRGVGYELTVDESEAS